MHNLLLVSPLIVLIWAWIHIRLDAKAIKRLNLTLTNRVYSSSGREGDYRMVIRSKDEKIHRLKEELSYQRSLNTPAGTTSKKVRKLQGHIVKLEKQLAETKSE